jgi:hypothetical protein
VRRRERHALLHRAVRAHRLLDLQRRQRLAAAVDHLFGAARDENEPLAVDVAQVARVEPAVRPYGFNFGFNYFIIIRISFYNNRLFFSYRLRRRRRTPGTTACLSARSHLRGGNPLDEPLTLITNA